MKARVQTIFTNILILALLALLCAGEAAAVSPEPVVNLQVTGGDTEINLNWELPQSATPLKGIIVLRMEGSAVSDVPPNGGQFDVRNSAWYSWSRTVTSKGQLLHIITDTAVNSFTDVNLMPGIEYHYAVFTADDLYNYSAPAIGSVSPTHIPVTYTVSLDGTGDFSSISEAIQMAKPSDTVFLKPGSYSESIKFKNGINLVGESPDTVTINKAASQSAIAVDNCPHGSIQNIALQGDGSWSQGVYLYNSSAIDFNNVMIRGFSIGIFVRGTAYTPRTTVVENSTFENTGTGLTILYGKNHHIIRNNNFLDNRGTGIYLKDGSSSEVVGNHFQNNGTGIFAWERSNPLIKNNTMIKNGTGIGHAWSSRPTIEGNIISESYGTGIYAVSYSSPIIKNNIISKSGGDGFWGHLNWPRLYNNTIVENGGNGVSSEYYGSIHMQNNIVAFNGEWGTYGMDTYTNYPKGRVNLYYNDVFGNGSGDTNSQSYLYAGNIFEDPTFRDIAASNYQLSWGSPAIDAGDSSSAYNDPDGTRNDMGAYGGPDALPSDPISVEEQVDVTVDTFITLPDNVFKNEAEGRKEEIETKFTEVSTNIETGEAETDPAMQLAYYRDALNKLENDLLKKCDGHFGGKPNNDWVTTYEAQITVYPLIINLINEVKFLIDSVKL